MAVATQVTPGMHRSARPRRLLVRLINHDFLHRALGPEQAPNLYGELENVLATESHYWLQRGSFALEFGNLRLAETFLNQAKGLSPDDNFVQNEYAYLLFKKALENVSSVHAPELVSEAMVTLEKNIADKGAFDPHPYHILGSQGLAWSRRGLHKFEEKKVYLERLKKMIEAGVTRHPTNGDLKSLNEAVETEYLNLALRA